mmetsp:Transcript_1628/g.3655  ORF Transcript_1628/g.3655 Transcript_1628/m.3655 type:complete len:229 (-) Transcript_1628:98-784(-)
MASASSSSSISRSSGSAISIAEEPGACCCSPATAVTAEAAAAHEGDIGEPNGGDCTAAAPGGGPIAAAALAPLCGVRAGGGAASADRGCCGGVLVAAVGADRRPGDCVAAGGVCRWGISIGEEMELRVLPPPSVVAATAASACARLALRLSLSACRPSGRRLPLPADAERVAAEARCCMAARSAGEASERERRIASMTISSSISMSVPPRQAGSCPGAGGSSPTGVPA